MGPFSRASSPFTTLPYQMSSKVYCKGASKDPVVNIHQDLHLTGLEILVTLRVYRLRLLGYLGH